jgi:hypothetical protein
MAVNKNFVVKNGLEVDTDLVLANAETRSVGIGTTRPAYLLEVSGGIGVTDINAIGIITAGRQLRVGASGTVFSVLATRGTVGVGTTNPAYLLDVRGPVSVGQTSLYVRGDAVFTGDVRVNDIFFDETEYIRVSGILTAANLYVFNQGTIATGIITNLSSGVGTISTITGNVLQYNSIGIGVTEVIDSNRQLKNIIALDPTTTATIQAGISTVTVQSFINLSVSGISTLGTVKISSGIVTAVSGVVTYFGDGSNLTRVRIGVRSEGTQVSASGTTGTSVIDFRSTTGQNINVDSNTTTGITTVTITPGVSLGLAIALGG